MAWKTRYTGIAVVFVLLSCQHAVFRGDVVYLLNEEELRGEVVKIDGRVVIRGDEEKSIARDSVIAIKLGKKREGWEWKEVKDIKDPVLKRALLSDYKPPGAGWVNLWVEKKLILKEDSSYVYEERRIRKILDEKGTGAGNIKISYLGRCERAEILWGRSVSGGKVYHLEEIAIERGNPYGNYPGYENERILKFALPECRPGSVVDYAVRIEGRWDKKIPLFYAFTTGDRDPTLHERIVLETDGVEVELSGPWRSEGERWVWEEDSLPGIVKEPRLPPRPYLFPFLSVSVPSPIELEPESIDYPGNEPDEIFISLMKSLEILPFPSSRTSIFPLPPHEVLEKGRGTRMDVAFLLYSILKTKGYDCDMVLVRSREEGESPGKNIREFDGALVRCRERWYDPGDFLNPPGWISPDYQGTRGYSLREGRLVEIPRVEEVIEIERDVRVEGRDAVIEERIVLSGEEGKEWRRMARRKKEEVKRFVERYVNSVEPGSELVSWKIENVDEITKPLEVKLIYRIPGFFTPSGRFLVFHVPGVHPSARDVGAMGRVNPLYLKKTKREAVRVTLTIPHGYRISHLPVSLSATSPPFEFDLKVIREKDRIRMEWERVEKGGVYSRDVYPSYRKARLREAELGEKWIILERR